jgi:hypothetical protein
MSEKANETFETDTCNIRVQSWQHMQYPDLFLQHPYKNTCNISLKQLKHTLTTWVFNATSPCCSAEWRLVGVWCSPEAVARRQWLHIAEGRHQPHEQRGGCGRTTWRGQPRTVTRRQPRAMPSMASGRALHLRGGRAQRLVGPATVHTEAAGE